MKRPLVSIIFVNWNGKKYIKSCLDSLKKLDYSNYEVIFVDNNSADGSSDFVKKHYPQVKLVQNRENLGFAQGHDTALPHAKGEAILLLNVDTTVDKLFLGYLVKRLYSARDIGIVQPKVLLDPDRNLIDSVGSFFLNNGLLYHYGREKDTDLSQYNRTMNIFSAKGVCMLIRRKVIEEVGLFDPDFFIYYEETDFCMRTWLSGWRTVYEPKAVIYHKGGHAASQKPQSFIQFHAFKNVLFTYLKNLSPGYLVRVFPKLTLYYFLGFIFYCFSGKFTAASSIMKALWWNIANFRKIMIKRKFIQTGLRKVKDSDYLPALTFPVGLSYYYRQFFGGLGEYKDKPILQA